MKKEAEEGHFVADEAEFKEACHFYGLMKEHKILQLERYIKSLKPEALTIKELNGWFKENNRYDSPNHRLLAYQIRIQKTPEMRYKSCLQSLRKKYKARLVEQYRPLIICVLERAELFKNQDKYRRITAQKMVYGVFVNGKKIPALEKEQEGELLSRLELVLKGQGILEVDSLQFLMCILGFLASFESHFFPNMLKAIEVGAHCGGESIHIEINPEADAIALHFVWKVKKFYRIKNSEIRGQGANIWGESSKVEGQSKVSFKLIRSKDHPPFEMSLCGATFEVVDEYAGSVIAKDRAKYYERRLCNGKALDVNEERGLSFYMREYHSLVKTEMIIEKLIADQDPLKIVLAVRMNRKLLSVILKNPKLLPILCSSSNCLTYLWLFKFWFILDAEILGPITSLISIIEAFQTKFPDKTESIVQLFRNKDEDNLLFLFSAIYSLLPGKKQDITGLIRNPEVNKHFFQSNCIVPHRLIDLATKFQVVAFWMVEEGLISKLNSDQFCELLCAQPTLFEKIQQQNGEILERLHHNLFPQQLSALLLNNKSKKRLEIATCYVFKSRELFDRLCQLKETRPKELLRYFTMFFKEYQGHYGDSYLKYQKYLLQCVDEASLARYYEASCDALSDKQFCDLFEKNILSFDDNGPETRSHLIEKKALILNLLKRIKQGTDLPQIYTGYSYLCKLSQLLSVEPRIALLFRFKKFITALNGPHQDRQLVETFVNCVITHCTDPDFSEQSILVLALGLLRPRELKGIINSTQDKSFLIKVLIEEPSSISMIAPVLDENPSFNFVSLISTMPVQQLLMLTISFLMLKNKLSGVISSSATMSGFSKSKHPFAELFSHITKILDMEDLSKKIRASDEVTKLDRLCIHNLCPEFSQRIGEASRNSEIKTEHSAVELSTKPELLLEDKRLVEGFSAKVFVDGLERLLKEKKLVELQRLVNFCVLKAFINTDVMTGILNTPKLLMLIVDYGDLQLVAKWIGLFFRHLGFENCMPSFLERLSSELVLLSQYRLIFNLPSLNKEEPAIINPLSTATEVLSSNTESDLKKAIQSQSSHPNLILQAIIQLHQNHPDADDFIDEFLDDSTVSEIFTSADIGQAIRVLVSVVDFEFNNKDQEKLENSRLQRLFGEFFFISNEAQLRLVSIEDCVLYLLEMSGKCDSDLLLYSRFVLPRMALALIYLFDTKPHVVENLFLENKEMVKQFRDSEQAMDELLNSSMYETSKTVQEALAVSVLTDSNSALEDSVSVLVERSPITRRSYTPTLLSRDASSQASTCRSEEKSRTEDSEGYTNRASSDRSFH